MLASGVGKIYDGPPGDMFVRDVGVNGVVVAETRGAPVHLDNFDMLPFHNEPVAWLKWLADFQRDAGDDVAEQILHRKGDDADDDGGTEERALDGFAVDNTDDEDHDNHDDGEPHELAEEFWRLDVAAFFKPTLPKIAAQQREEHEPAEDEGHSAEVLHHGTAPREIESREDVGQPDRDHQAKEDVERAQARRAGAASTSDRRRRGGEK